MGVDVDPARSHDHPVGVDLVPTGPDRFGARLDHRNDHLLVDRNVGSPALGAVLSGAAPTPSPVADGVVAGTASAYAAVDATTTAQLSVTALGTAAPLFSAVDQTFSAAATYSVFLVGSASAPVGIVRKDR